MSTENIDKQNIPINPRYSVIPYLHNRWNKYSRQWGLKAKTLQEYKIWRKKLIKKLKELTGYITMQKSPLHPNVLEEVDCGTYIRRKVEIQTEPSVWMPFYILIPKEGKAPFPVILAFHGHGSGGKFACAGITELQPVAEAITKLNYNYGEQFVKEGFIVFCPDARGFGERREKFVENNLIASSCGWINNMAFPLGQTVAGMWTWDIHRLLEYIDKLKECDKNRIGCVGLSGGGLQTLWATALDEECKIKAAVISGYFYGYKESLIDMCGNCSCNYVPHLYEYVDMGDIGALIAPRPLLIETGTNDPLNGASGVNNVISQVKITQKAYNLFKKPELLYHDVFEGGHIWHGVHAIPWMKKHLGNKD